MRLASLGASLRSAHRFARNASLRSAHCRHAYKKANLMDVAVDALKSFTDDVLSGAYPEKKHSIGMKDDEYAKFMASLPLPP